MTIRLQDLGSAVLGTEYAVRGPIVARAQVDGAQGREIIYCNIGNPQALEQKPLTYLRQVLALCQYPALMDLRAGAFPRGRAGDRQGDPGGTRHGLGAYSESKGVRFIREAVAEFILERDRMRRGSRGHLPHGRRQQGRADGPAPAHRRTPGTGS